MEDPIGFGGALTERAADHPDRSAVVMGSERVTYRALERSANRLARELAARGVAPGGFVATALENSPDLLALVFAIWKIGAVPFPMNPRLPAREREALVDLAGPAVVVGAGGTALEQLLEGAAERDDSAHLDVLNDPWKAIGTGGSTGRPKLIVDGASSPAGMAMAGSLLGLHRDQAQLHVAPLCHNGPFMVAVAHLVMGGTLHLQPRFDAETWLDTLERERIGWVYVVPTMLHRLFRLPEDRLVGRDLSALEMVFHTAGPCPPWLKRRTIDYFGPERVLELYGATEGGAAGSTLIRGDEWLGHPGSVGRLVLPGSVLKIGDEEGRELPTGEVGLVWVKPAGGMPGTYRGADLQLVDGYYAVGDLGRVDDDGYLYLADRRTDMIVSGGVNVYPAEVEAVLLEHPAVADVAVIGLPDEEWGQRVHAVVAREAGAEGPDVDDLAAHGRAHLAGPKVPRSWEIVAELPRDPSGKIRRSQMRDERVAEARRPAPEGVRQ